MTLYLKYRPKNLDELDIPEVSESLKKIVKSGNIPHAFLFSGPKGTGKTSAARILAKIINCENLGNDGKPCEKCEQCVSISKGNNLDVIEMDAASHRGIDDVRTLRDAVKLAPAVAKKKIYIIDEAHMLTTEASNALLKTLEEPPEHVTFILATTNPEKLIDTIRSRVTNIPFRKATPTEIVKSLKRVITGEKISADESALLVIAEAAGGAFRDAIKILEQLVAEERELSKEFLQEYLFKNKSFDTDRFIHLLEQKDVKNLIIEIGKLAPSGVTTEIFLESLIGKLREGLLSKAGIGENKLDLSEKDLVNLIELFIEAGSMVADSPIEELPLELAVIKWCGEKGENHSQTTHLKHNSRSDEVGVGGIKTLTSADKLTNTLDHEEEYKNDAQTDVSGVRSQENNFPGEVNGMGVNDDAWKTILSMVKPLNASIEALLRGAKPIGYDGKVLTLGVYYKFHKERLEDGAHRKILEGVLAKVLNSTTKVVCTIVDPPTRSAPVLTESADNDIIKAAEEIFGN